MPSSLIDSAVFRDIFSTEAMRKVFSDENRVQKYLDLEAALARGVKGPAVGCGERDAPAHTPTVLLHAIGSSSVAAVSEESERGATPRVSPAKVVGEPSSQLAAIEYRANCPTIKKTSTTAPSGGKFVLSFVSLCPFYQIKIPLDVEIVIVTSAISPRKTTLTFVHMQPWVTLFLKIRVNE